MAENRRMCPQCRAFITNKDRKCPYCGEPMGPRSFELREPANVLGGLIPQAHFTTVLILLVNVVLFIAAEYMARSIGEPYALLLLGAKNWEAIHGNHEWWRIVTAGFLHMGFAHILMNSWVLYDLGAQVEQIYGTARFLTIFIISSIGGFWLSYVMTRSQSVGASAGMTGLIGAMIAFGMANRSSVGKQIRDFYVRWVIYIAAFGLLPMFHVDNWAHFGGLAAGFAVGYISGTPLRSTPVREAVWRAMAGVSIAVTVLCFWQVYRHFPTAQQFDYINRMVNQIR